MTLVEYSFLIINRLSVFSDGQYVYDEFFREGINIIRGENSSGKSSIMDFIFFVLGGDLTKWKPEALRCDYIIAEININNSIFTIKRRISESSRQHMSIYTGNYEDALKTNIEGWQIYPFQRGQKKFSFSQILFKFFKYPEVRGDGDSNITMHQLLRLLYIDQLSNVQSILRDEMFDSPITRRTIGDLMLGFYDSSIYKDELKLRELEKQIDTAKEQIKNLNLLFKESGQEKDLHNLQHAIESKEKQLCRIDKTLSKYDSTKSIEPSQIDDKTEQLRLKYISSQNELVNARNEINSLSLDINDSREFIRSIDFRLKSLDQSLKARSALSNISISHCPICLSEISGVKEPNVCHLCKNPISIEGQKLRIDRLKQELLFQLNESKSLIIAKEDKLDHLNRKIPELSNTLKIAKNNLNVLLLKVRTKRNKELDDLLVLKGSLENELTNLSKQSNAVIMLDNLNKRMSDLSARETTLRISIKNKRAQLVSRMQNAYDKIESKAKSLLKSDLPRQEEFMNPENIVFDFSKNIFSVNDKNQFSASSIVYLKNCIHYSIFFASLDLQYFRYPRFILCDNMEDKGMEEARSQNFQKIIVNNAMDCTSKFQIIFSTSKIHPDLNNSKYCVGEFYTQKNKTLKFN